MAARYVEQFTVRTPDELEELEEAIGEGQLEAVVVDVPDGASAFQTAREFRHLLNIARSADVEIELSTDDPVRRELARIMGFRLASDAILDTPVPDRPVPDCSPASRTFRIVRPAGPETIDVTADPSDPAGAGELPTYRPWQASEPSEMDDDDIDDGSYGFVIHPPTTRRPATQPFEPRARQAETIQRSGIGETPVRNQMHPQSAPLRATRLRRFRWLILTLTLALVAAVLVTFLLPAATIAITPVESNVSASLTYGVALPGTDWDIAIQPQTVSTTLTFSATIPTTGERFEPDTAARGSVLLTNASTSEIVVPAGTIVANETGVQFTTTTDVTVPAADPYGSLTIGSATVEVVAVAPGPDSNVEAETLYGQLDSGIYYLNRDPIGGGANRRIATVSPTDIDTLNQRAKTDLDARSIGAIDKQLANGQQLLDGTERRGQLRTTFDRAAGADADTLRLDASLTISAEAYSLGNIHGEARAAVADQLRVQAGDRAAVLADTLQTSEPLPIVGSNGTAFSVNATARVRAIVRQEELDALRGSLTGKDAGEALARIEQIPGVGSVRIDRSPTWLGKQMPRLESRIQIEVINAPRVSTQTPASGP